MCPRRARPGRAPGLQCRGTGAGRKHLGAWAEKITNVRTLLSKPGRARIGTDRRWSDLRTDRGAHSRVRVAGGSLPPASPGLLSAVLRWKFRLLFLFRSSIYISSL